MASTFGSNLKLTIFGTSHGAEIGMTLEGIPAGLPVDLPQLQAFLDRRAPGKNPWSTARKESDMPRFLTGLTDGCTNGEPIHAVIRNENVRKGDYAMLQNTPRPGHADFAAWMKYGLAFDMSGGGAFSGRMTAPMCIAGGLCMQWLAANSIRIGAHIAWIHDIDDNRFDPLKPDLDGVQADFPVLNRISGDQMQEAIAQAKLRGDSVGGIIECAAVGVPAGIGGELFGGVESKLSQILYGIPAVKGVDFGLGFANMYHYGSYTNDAYAITNDRVTTVTNHCGGILGGITTGMPILLRVAMKPTPSIARAQQSVNLKTMEPVTIQVQGRHDPCILPRAVPVVEAGVAIGLMDLLLEQRI